MTPNNEIKQQAMSAVTGVKSVAQHVGLAKITLGAAVYAAHVRQMNRRNHSGQRRLPLKTAVRDLYE